eukprot:4220974-Pyramimonas_sp.AAC.1
MRHSSITWSVQLWEQHGWARGSCAMTWSYHARIAAMSVAGLGGYADGWQCFPVATARREPETHHDKAR